MKKEQRFKIEFDFDWTYGIEISKLREDLDTLERLGANEIYIQTEDNWGSSSVSIEAFTKRLETDDEYSTRLLKEKEKKEEIKRKELEQFEKLKIKYGL